MRFDDCICGTSSTGTGTLSLAATPVPPGGADFDVLARSEANFGNSATCLVDYTITEYTDATFSTEKQKESGIGTLTLGASAGIANCTLARTSIDYTITSLNLQPATFNAQPGTGISIGTAANTLVACSPRVESLLASSRFFDTTNFGPGNMIVGSAANLTVTNNQIAYVPFFNTMGRYVSEAMVSVGATYSGQNNNVYVAIYENGTNGRPGKLLADFGALGTPNAAFASGSTVIASAPLASPLWLPPGIYWYAVKTIWTTGGSGTPSLLSEVLAMPPIAGFLGTRNATYTTASAGGVGAFTDPATTTSYAYVSQSTTGNAFWAGFE